MCRAFCQYLKTPCRVLGKRFKVVEGDLYDMKNNKASFFNKKTGYCYIKSNKKEIKAHRLIWTLEHKRHIKEGMVIDHINTVTTDNHPLNLREVSNENNIKLIFKNRKTTCQIISLCEQSGIGLHEFSEVLLKYESLRRQVYDCAKDIHRPQRGYKPAGAGVYEQAKGELRDFKKGVYWPALKEVLKGTRISRPYLFYFAHNWKRLYGFGPSFSLKEVEKAKEWKAPGDFGHYHKHFKTRPDCTSICR